MKKTYTINYEDKAELTVEIDHSIMTEENLEEINSFWSNDKYRITECGSTLNAVLIMLAQEVFSFENPLLAFTEYAIRRFDWDQDHGIEGWPKMDGSYGIKILDIDSDIFGDYDDFTVTEKSE